MNRMSFAKAEPMGLIKANMLDNLVRGPAAVKLVKELYAILKRWAEDPKGVELEALESAVISTVSEHTVEGRTLIKLLESVRGEMLQLAQLELPEVELTKEQLDVAMSCL